MSRLEERIQSAVYSLQSAVHSLQSKVQSVEAGSQEPKDRILPSLTPNSELPASSLNPLFSARKTTTGSLPIKGPLSASKMSEDFTTSRTCYDILARSVMSLILWLSLQRGFLPLLPRIRTVLTPDGPV